MRDFTVNRFRTARGRVLRRQIDALAAHLGRPVTVLDLGGRADYWDNVGYENIARIRLLNNDESELDRQRSTDLFTEELGDACDLKEFADKSVDLVHSNSVIEHVGHWPAMCAFADEARRVGVAGWIQTPAWEFPIEPHFRMPFLHWFGQPARRAMLRMSKDYGTLGTRERRLHIDRINLLSRGEMTALFPDCGLFVERVLFPKSYTARWGPQGVLA
ncbi:MAG: methyltransferase domain-containing protein [Methylobacterium mesophilicum]|nr:methyltransferase domain-containing protein [Methylobacterium mesophilicum]